MYYAPFDYESLLLFCRALNFKIHHVWCDNSNKNITFVSPAMGATLQTFLDRRVLMIELFPTLG